MSEGMLSSGDLLTESELAPKIGFSVNTLRTWRTMRIGPPYHKIGRSVRYKIARDHSMVGEHED
jgi:hypothetical protein